MKTIFKNDPANGGAIAKQFDKPAILNRYRTVFHNYRADGIIDMDRRLKEKGEFTACKLEDILAFAPEPGSLPPVRSSNYMMVLITSGKGEKIIGARSYDLCRHALYFIPKRMVHSSRTWSTDTTGYIINFNADFFDQRNFPADQIFGRKLFKGLQTPCLHLDEQAGPFVQQLFERIIEEFNCDDIAQNELLPLKVLELLIACERAFQKAGLTCDEVVRHPVIEKFNELVEMHFAEIRNVQWYADQLCVHPNHLNYLLKKYSAVNAKESINNRIVLEAKSLLALSGLMVKDVAHRVGFDDPNNFSTFFQKNTGCSPASFRSTDVQQQANEQLAAS
ncbi:helix-turn-helix domain-containing protein [Mucilaginibacter sp. SJ]|uniref:helix-turn-helix domain-containing protein n=1 Tax=Mucilaginibacter sp. SJ TaxID=3029053 RepID=UPI0023A9E506|nr:helix-turn-helix domain-containing protein [Mucilaginibacter sp. SJ]WEA01797.1 helix-turn-helix transcriptional regulator [Mucilaginibacter sp. SJ]